MSENRMKEAQGEGGGEAGVLSLEARLQRLEEIVGLLESEELELERALALFEEGVGHVKAAERLLAAAELRVEQLVGEEGELRTEPLEEPDS